MNDIKNPILAEYASYLKSQNIDYRAGQGFSVRFELQNADVAFIDVDINGKTVTLFDYFGTCYTGIRNTNRVAKVLKEKYPTYTIWIEKYTTFEIDVEEKFSFRSIANLHKRVCKMAAVIDEGAGIGKEMLGDAFDR